MKKERAYNETAFIDPVQKKSSGEGQGIGGKNGAEKTFDRHRGAHMTYLKGESFQSGKGRVRFCQGGPSWKASSERQSSREFIPKTGALGAREDWGNGRGWPARDRLHGDTN